MAAEKPTAFLDGFSNFSGGADSGVKPLGLPKTDYAYGTNTTCRGQYLTHRPAYRKQTLILDTDVTLGKLRFQGACYYQPDFGAESIVAQIGGRLFQFVPDTQRSAYVYDRTVRNYFNGVSFTTQTNPTTANQNFTVTLQNINDSSGAIYPSGTPIQTDPAVITQTILPASANPVLINGGTQLQYTMTLTLPPNYILPENVGQGLQIFINADGVSGQVKWTITDTGMSGLSPTLDIQFITTSGGSTITYLAGSILYYTTNPEPPQTIGTTSGAFTAPGVGANVLVPLGSIYNGNVGDYLLIGGGVYLVTAFSTASSVNSTVTTTTETTSNNSTQFAYDPNPAGTLQAWLWQSENYVIVQDGLSRPIFFNGQSSRRSLTATFIGTAAQSFSVPAISQPVNITLNAPFPDAVGTYINISALNLFPFLMQVIAVNVGGNPNVITAVNRTGQTATNQIIPIGTPINSTSSPTYSGVLTENIPAGIMPGQGSSINQQGSPLTLSVSPPYMGSVGDTILLTDGTGDLTTYQFTIDAITGGGSGLTVTNNSAPFNLIINVGYPVISQSAISNELPIGRMGAYVQGRNWISSVDGKSFIASDQVGDSSGTQQFNDRDAVLKWSINTTKFSIPGGAGQINCIVALGAIDASLGQGPLQILCDNQIFTCTAPNDATTWATTTSPILPNSIIGFGGTGQNAAVVSNGDLILKSGDATIHSLKLARQDFNQWGNLPISQEMNRVTQQENINLLNFITFAIADNRALASCSPIISTNGIFSQGIIALDFDVTSSLQGKLPSVYDGVWKDLNVLQIVSGKFNKVDRTFAFSLNSTTNEVELWEILKDGIADDNGSGTLTPITWSFESPMIFNAVKGKGEFDLVQLKDGDIYFSDLVGQASFKVWWRVDFSSCWHLWHKFTIANKRPEPSYFMRAGLGEPTSRDLSDTLNSTPATVGRFFQIRIEITGSLVFQGALFKSVPFVENTPARVICD